jgi:hypothetical protein
VVTLPHVVFTLPHVVFTLPRAASGTISLDALRWLHDIDAAFVQIDNDGTVITVWLASGARTVTDPLASD